MHKHLLSICGVVSMAVGGVMAAGIPSGTHGVELKGTARVHSRPEPNAVIWLETPGTPMPPQTQKVVLYQRNLTFTPRVLAIRVGTTVDFPNDDRVFHNVFSFKDGKKFDLGIYPVGTRKRVVFTEPGVSRLFCNIHPHMAGYVVAVDSLYFSAVDESGAFSIPDVPPGKYAYHAWRPGSPVLTGTMSLEPGSLLEVLWP